MISQKCGGDSTPQPHKPFTTQPTRFDIQSSSGKRSALARTAFFISKPKCMACSAEGKTYRTWRTRSGCRAWPPCSHRPRRG